VAGYEDKNGKDRKQRKGEGKGSGYDAPFRGYINLNLSDEQKAGYGSWSESASLWDIFSSVVEDGVNIAIKKDPKGEGYLASATQRREDSPNAGLVCTARAKEPSLAWGRLLFILAILSHHERWEDTQPMADPDRW